MAGRYDEGMEPDPLPTPHQQHLLCGMIGRAFVEIRELGLAGSAQQAADLADAFHNFPTEIYDDRVFCWDRLRDALLNYQAKWRPENKRSIFDYLGMLAEIRGQ